jgi:hypothetical protein
MYHHARVGWIGVFRMDICTTTTRLAQIFYVITAFMYVATVREIACPIQHRSEC